MRSLSPENQPSSLPPNLTALVLTLFEVGGVDSMTAETKTEESTLHKILQEMLREILQEMLQLVVLVEEICSRFYSSKRINMNLISLMGTWFSESEHLTLLCTENVRKS